MDKTAICQMDMCGARAGHFVQSLIIINMLGLGMKQGRIMLRGTQTHGQRMTLTSNSGAGGNIWGTLDAYLSYPGSCAASLCSAAVELQGPGTMTASVIITLQASCELLGLISRCSHLNTMREAKMQQGMGRGINFTFYIRNYPGLSIHTDMGWSLFCKSLVLWA